MFITPKWSAPSTVKAASTTRLGGVSQAEFAALNLGDHVGDFEQAVASNRARLARELDLPGEPVWLKQVHGVELVDATRASEEADGSLPLTADGSYTKTSNTVCVVMTADCLPLLLTNKAGSQIAAVHAGWRGMASGIIERAVAMFDCDPADLIAWAGPCIGPQKFEIGQEVRERLGGSEQAYQTLGNGKLLANLYQLCGERLSALGVAEYSHADVCTYSDAERFFSYRRDGQCGRMASLIWLADEQ